MKSAPGRAAGRLGIAVAVLGLLLALVINHHWFYPDFNFLPGDRGDTRLVIFTLEHWLNAFKGNEPPLLLNMFYPDKLALGYADGLILFAIPYAAFRLLGFDYFTSYQLLFGFMTVLGYTAWLVLLRRALNLSTGFAVLGAVLLTCLNALQQQAQIGKLTAFDVYPILIGLLVIYARLGDKRRWSAWASLAAFSILLGALFFTSYYPAWFFLFTLGLFGVVVLAASLLRKGVGATLAQVGEFVISQRWQLLVCVLAGLVSLAPFVLTYAPLVLSDAKRSFDLVLEFAPSPRDIINVSAQNYVWSPILRWAGFKFGNVELQMGSPVIVLMLFAGFYLKELITRLRGAVPVPNGRARTMFLLSTTALVVLGLTVQVHGFSLWYPIYRFVPGASALRALGRYLIVFDMLAVTAVVYALNEMYRSLHAFGPRPNPYAAGGAMLLGMALIVEQLNGSPYRLDKSQQLASLARYQEPRIDCQAFFISNPDSTDLPVGYYQLDAMMISMKLGIPTVNGYSGFAPNVAFTLVPTGVEYEYRIRQWLSQNGVQDGICELDAQSAAFRGVNVPVELAEYEQLYRASYLNTFDALYSAAGRFLADGNVLSSLYPQYLEEHGYLDRSLGYEFGARSKWIQARYWIGERACNRGPCLGIGVVGTYADVRAIIDKYGAQAYQIYFPYPKRYVADASTPGGTQGELLMVFSGTSFPH